MIRDDITIIVNVYQLLDKESVKEFFFFTSSRDITLTNIYENYDFQTRPKYS
jgi:hypothetical protein